MKVLILGAGLSGFGASYLMQQQGHDVTLANQTEFDTKDLHQLGIRTIFSDDVSVNDGSYDVFIKAPGIVDDHPLVSSFETVSNEIEWAYRYSPSYDYYAISGTNGKTTATTLLHQMLLKKDDKALLAGNVGIALSQKVFEDHDFKRLVALEISGFQIDGLDSFQARAFGLLNLSPDHLDHYQNVESYYQSKLNLIAHSDVFIRNIDDANIMSLTKQSKHTLDLSLKQKADIYRDGDVIKFKETVLFPVSALKVKGQHNLYNASMAASIAYLAGVMPDQVEASIAQFKAVEHRCEYVDTINGIDYYNDSKATNPESLAVCLDSFEAPVILLAGGHDKHISFDLLKQYQDKIKHAFLFGESALQLASVFENHTLVEEMKDGFELAHQMASSGDVILLSPACASYDQFRSFEHRGQVFKDLVKNIK